MTTPVLRDAWLRWTHEVQTNLEAQCPPYLSYQPSLHRLPDWPACRWTIDELKAIIPDSEVQVQASRNHDPDYELHALAHRHRMPWHAFLDVVFHGPANDVYLTAQNRLANLHVLRPLYRYMEPVPEFVHQDASLGYFWLGKETITQLHHDVKHNLLCQIWGTKLVRTVAPQFIDSIAHRVSVFSHAHWYDGPHYQEWIVEPGWGLFLPAGYWHCVKSVGLAWSIVFDAFVWNDCPHLGFVSL